MAACGSLWTPSYTSSGQMLSSCDCVLSSFFFFSSRRRHTRCSRDWSSDVCSSDLLLEVTASVRQSAKSLARALPFRHGVDDSTLTGRRYAAHRDGGAEPRSDCRSEERRVGKECRSRWSPYH